MPSSNIFRSTKWDKECMRERGPKWSSPCLLDLTLFWRLPYFWRFNPWLRTWSRAGAGAPRTLNSSATRSSLFTILLLQPGFFLRSWTSRGQQTWLHTTTLITKRLLKMFSILDLIRILSWNIGHLKSQHLSISEPSFKVLALCEKHDLIHLRKIETSKYSASFILGPSGSSPGKSPSRKFFFWDNSHIWPLEHHRFSEHWLQS